MNITDIADWKFISDREGGRATIGYVPQLDGKGIESGVTIATGFDLGQRNEYDLRNLPQPIFTKLYPYLTVTGYKAKELLSRYPLKVTEAEAELIDKVSHEEVVTNFLLDWNRADAKIPFEYLDINLRTAALSVAIQYGDLPSRTPNYWRQITSCNWEAAYYNLMDFKDDYPTRRRLEATLVGKVLFNA